ERIKNQVVDFVKNVDWKKVAIVAAATVAAGGGTQALVSGVLSGKDGKTILKDTLEGIKGGAVTGAFTGGLTGGLGAASSSVTNSLVRHGVDTVGETVIDTISDAAQGGQITPTSIGTSLLLNAVTEGVSSRTVGAPKADVVTTKPTTGGRLPMTLENLQMFAEKPEAKSSDIVNVNISKSKYPETAQHIEDAIKNGQPSILTIDRENAKLNRKEALRGTKKVPNKDLDEYPPAMFKEGGAGASVRPIGRSDNRGSGSTAGHQLRPYDDGTKVNLI
ncbi:NucA/NucB deoxyribonuclease domain-containing protein, partial [Streptococcus oralis]|uniref:NucA/NucB deoxyribonuclease domain-containing protein n=1 Tax=Streptococcus oralis TaxID=1303 RepID=UPI00077807D8